MTVSSISQRWRSPYVFILLLTSLVFDCSVAWSVHQRSFLPALPVGPNQPGPTSRHHVYHWAQPPSSAVEEKVSVDQDGTEAPQKLEKCVSDVPNDSLELPEDKYGTHGSLDEQDKVSETFDDRYLELEATSAVTRRRWLQQTGAIFGGSSALIGTSLISSSVQQRMQQQQQRQELLQTSDQAFVRLEPYPTRRRSRSGSRENNTTAAAAKATSWNQTSNAVSSNPNKNATAGVSKTRTVNATKTGTSSNTTKATGKEKKAKTSAGTNQTNASNTKSTSTTTKKELAPVNFTKVAAENTINITLKDCDTKGGCTQINGTSFQKVKIPDPAQTPPSSFLRLLPPFLRPAAPQVVVKDIPDSEILLAATVAGSLIEMGRTTLLYPLSTIKTRIQTRQREQQQIISKRRQRRHMERWSVVSNASASVLRQSPMHNNNTNSKSYEGFHNASSRQRPSREPSQRAKKETSLRRRLRVLQLNIRRHTAEGNLYAGLLPSLLVSVPATGVYYSVRDITKRALSVTDVLALDDAIITLLGALNADVISLMIRTPADALAARLQAAAASQPAASKKAPVVPDDSGRSNSVGVQPVQDGGPGAKSEQQVSDFLVMVEGNRTSTLGSEICYREEAENYRVKGGEMVLNNTHAIDTLFESVLPGEYDHGEQFLLLQLQRQEYNVNDLMDGLFNEDVHQRERPPELSKRQWKRIRRNAIRKERKYRSREVGISLGDGTPSHHHFIRDFLEANTLDGKEGVDSQNLLRMSTAIDEWGAKLEKLRIARSMPTARDGTSNATKGKKLIGDLESGENTADDGSMNAGVENTTKVSTDMEPTVARMDDKEERQLVQNLQEKSIYNQAWLLESLERLPAIIITDLPYLLSRIALNRIIIHGKVNIGQYEVQTIAIAMFCALLSTPFDVVRTRLLVEIDSQESMEDLSDTSIGNTTVVSADGSVVLVGINGTGTDVHARVQKRNQGGVLETMISIAKEGDGGVRNLYAGWLERTVYYGIGRAWLDPINIITYVGIRDTLLLQWFD